MTLDKAKDCDHNEKNNRQRLRKERKYKGQQHKKKCDIPIVYQQLLKHGNKTCKTGIRFGDFQTNAFYRSSPYPELMDPGPYNALENVMNKANFHTTVYSATCPGVANAMAVIQGIFKIPCTLGNGLQPHKSSLANRKVQRLFAIITDYALEPEIVGGINVGAFFTLYKNLLWAFIVNQKEVSYIRSNIPLEAQGKMPPSFVSNLNEYEKMGKRIDKLALDVDDILRFKFNQGTENEWGLGKLIAYLYHGHFINLFALSGNYNGKEMKLKPYTDSCFAPHNHVIKDIMGIDEFWHTPSTNTFLQRLNYMWTGFNEYGKALQEQGEV